MFQHANGSRSVLKDKFNALVTQRNRLFGRTSSTPR